jgi:uncharacterized membrane protein
MATDRWDDQQIENIIGDLLLAGVLLSAFVVFTGGVIYLVRHGHEPADYHIFRGEPSDLRTVSGIIHDAFNLSARGLIQLGLLLLIATPVARVVFSIVGFAKEHDYLYVIIASIVLAILLYSLIGSAWTG